MSEWDIIDLYFKNHKYPFTNHHLDSYREFIKTYIPQTIKSYNPITMIKYDDNNKIIMKVDIYVGGEDTNEIFIDKPMTFENGSAKLITPNDARLKNLTYETHIYANILIKITDSNNDIITKKFDNIAIGSIPIMLHSDACILNGQGSPVLRDLGECVYDTGGYFIIDGKEKVIIAQERISTNRLFISKIKDDQNFSYKGLLRCTGETGETMLSPRTIEFYLVKNPDITIEDDVTEEYKKIKGTIVLSLPSIVGKIPLFIFFRALGIESDKDIYNMIFGDDNNEIETTFFINFIRPSMAYNYYEYDKKVFYIYTQEDALNYLKFRVKYNSIDHVKNILTSDVFPNINKFENKGKYLGYLIKQFTNTCLNISPVSDRDSYIYKRIDISGYLLAELFHESYMKLRKAIRDKMDSTYYFGSWENNNNYNNFITNDNIYKIIPFLLLSDTFTKSLKGRWGLAEDDDPELGRVQDLSRISYIGFLSHLRRVNMPLDRSIKVTAPHKLHSQQWGIMCPFETPDGASVGYLKNLAFLTKVTSGTNPEIIRECLIDIGVIPIENYDIPLNRNITKVFINGSWFGITGDPIKITRTLKAYRRNGLINILISISWHINVNEIRILTDAGRACRPLLIINQGDILAFNKKYNNWFEMLWCNNKDINYLNDENKNEELYYKNHYINPYNLDFFNKNDNHKDKHEYILNILEKSGCAIEYIDAEEEDTLYISMDLQNLNEYHTHLEIHPSNMMSVVSGNIPLANHNQSARNVFHAAQSKQAIGIYATSFNKRFDTMSYIHHYPQRPIISTRNSHYTSSDYMPNGFNVIVAIMTYSGFNQEDSIMINKKAIERGLFSLSYYKSITATSKIISQTERIIFANPITLRDKGYKIKIKHHANYNYLNDKGFISEGIYIPKGQKVVIAGMVKETDIYKEVKRGVFIEQVKETIYSDVSITTDSSLYGKIDKIYISNKVSSDDSIVYKIRFLKIKKPEFGDKHASRHGQKGVIGMILPEEGMPFTKDGIKPDIIINPHAIPSRMTIGHLVECVFAKFCCLNGVLGDGTVFIPFDNNIIYNDLNNMGFDKHGNEILYNGYNGNQINTEIFIGPTFYFRLKHMVAEKIHSRGSGPELPRVLLTRQPTAGRRKNGGLRIGEMERDSVLSHGVSLFMKESMNERSDKFIWAVCKKCGTLALYSQKNRLHLCSNCNKNDIALIDTPYSFKLLVQELETMGIQMRLNTEYVEEPIQQLEDIIENVNIEDKQINKKEDKQINKKEDKQINKKEDKQINKKDEEKAKKKCPDGQVLNPQTGRCIKEDGALAKKLGLKKTGGEGSSSDSDSKEGSSDSEGSMKGGDSSYSEDDEDNGDINMGLEGGDMSDQELKETMADVNNKLSIIEREVEKREGGFNYIGENNNNMNNDGDDDGGNGNNDGGNGNNDGGDGDDNGDDKELNGGNLNMTNTSVNEYVPEKKIININI
jgi:DNA-directed RNA polymerase II subunit RPB2